LQTKKKEDEEDEDEEETSLAYSREMLCTSA
jgi:hypothetical protein